jgi:RHS repeat-associated protein
LDNSYVRIRWKAQTKDVTPQNADFEVLLYRSGAIVFKYGALPSSNSARVGVTKGSSLNHLVVTGYDCPPATTIPCGNVPSNAQDVTINSAPDVSQALYTYDAADRLQNGGPVSGITYSGEGELTSITGPAPRGAWTLGYDARHLMTSQTSGGVTTTWTLDGEGRVARMTKGSNVTVYRYGGPGSSPAWLEDASGTVTDTFVGGPGGLLAQYNGSTPSFPLRNGNGDIIKFVTATGSTIEAFTYDEFGNPTSTQSPSRYGYAGSIQKERNPDSGLVRMGVRMYDPMVGRFTSTDPIAGGSLNDYVYAGHDPINSNDFSGLMQMEFDGGGGGQCQGSECDPKPNPGCQYNCDAYNISYSSSSSSSSASPAPQPKAKPKKPKKKWWQRALHVVAIAATVAAVFASGGTLTALLVVAWVATEAEILTSEGSAGQKLCQTAWNTVGAFVPGYRGATRTRRALAYGAAYAAGSTC